MFKKSPTTGSKIARILPKYCAEHKKMYEFHRFRPTFQKLILKNDFFDSFNGLTYLPPMIARHDCIKSLFLPNGRRILAPKAVRWSRFWAAYQFLLCYMPVMARCTNVSTAIIKNRMIAEMLHPRPAYLATPSIPPVPAKNKTT